MHRLSTGFWSSDTDARPWLGAACGLGWVAGTALQMHQPALGPVAGYMAACAGGLAVMAWLWRWHGSPAWRHLLALVAALGMAWGATGWRASVYAGGMLAPALEGRDVRVTAIIAAMPQPHEAGVRLRLQVEQAQGPDGPVRVPEWIDVSWYSGMWRDAAGVADMQRRIPSLRVGERWAMTVRLKAPHGLRNPHGFDYELWMWEQGVQATGYVRAGRKDEPPERLQATWRYPVEQARQAVRDAIVARLAVDGVGADAVAAQRRAGVVAALVTGDQRAIDQADWDLFRATGVAHLMSISGLHITLFAWLAMAVVGWLWRRSARLCLAAPAPTVALVAGVLLAGAYALFSGWGVPAQRTVTMLAVVALLRLSGRRWPWPQVWLLACVAALLWDPWALLQAGFWLSFVAVGILFATNSGAVTDRPVRGIGHFYALLREQWVVTLALTPLSLLLFGQVSLVGLVANVLAIPWVTLVVTPLALAGVLLPVLWPLAAWMLQPLVAVLGWMAAWPWAVVHLPAAPLWMGVAAIAGGVLLALRWPWPQRLLGAVLLVPVLAWRPAVPAPGTVELLALDIGQGNAVLVRTASHSLLYDAGPRYSRESDAGHRVVVPALRALGVRLDWLLLSHRDADHTGGAQAVLAQQPEMRLMGSMADDPQWQALRAIEPCARGQHWQWDGVTFEVLHPEPGAIAQAGRANTVSCVLRITTQTGASALLVGDIEAAQEQALVARAGAALKADLLLVPHHGSKTSSTPAFIQAVAPSIALVQAGYRNRFGHPAPDVLRRYEAQGITVVESAHCGAAWWQSTQPDRVQCERVRVPRYWQHDIP